MKKLICIILSLNIIFLCASCNGLNSSDKSKNKNIGKEISENSYLTESGEKSQSNKNNGKSSESLDIGDKNKSEKINNTGSKTSESKKSNVTASVIPKKDKYKTDPIPSGKPKPTEPQDVSINDKKSYTCTLLIECKTILNNMDKLKKGKEGLVKNGIIFKTASVKFYENESVFDLLKRVCRENKIHMEFTNTPIYNSAYIEGINNLYEFDCGSGSGWMYSVNGWFPNYGCSRYMLKPGDKVEWHYTCDLGKDINGSEALG